MLTFTVEGEKKEKDNFYVLLFIQIKHDKTSEEECIKIKFKK